MLSFNIARQRGPLGSERSPGPRQTSPNAEIHHDACMRDTLAQPNLSHIDFPDGPAAIHGSTTPYSCTTQSPSPNEHKHPEISMKNHQIFTYIFLGSGPAIFPASIISSHACIVFLSEASSSSHVILQHCASARTPGL